MTKPTVIFFDIDYTLFNTEKYRDLVCETIAKKTPNISSEKIKEMFADIVLKARELKYFDYPKQFTQLFTSKYPNVLSEKVLEEIWWQKEILQKALFPETLSVLQTLQKKQNTILGIFSSGKTEFQLAKISSLEDIFHTQHIHIAAPKEETLQELLKEYKDYAVILIDDFIDVLQKAKAEDPDVLAVWVKRGRYAINATMPKEFTPDLTITNLNEFLAFLDNQEMQ